MSTDITEPTTSTAKRRPGKTWLISAAAGIMAVAIGTAVAVNVSDGGSKDNLAGPAPVVLALKGSGTDPMMGMCMQFDVNQLKTAGVAFGGVVSSITSDTVTLDVDRWYKGTPKADKVTLAVPPGGANVALDGIEFKQGARYLISATDGVLGTCGYSGPASADFEKYFVQAFGTGS